MGFDAICQDKFKVLEKSGKRPSWCNGVEDGYIITFGNGQTSELAKEECLKNIQQQIANAIAVTVKSKTEVNIEQKNGVTNEKFKHVIESQTANLPFLKGISLSKASDFYWEKLENKSNKEIVFGYYVKYPFSDAALANLIAEYNENDAKYTKLIADAEIFLDTATSFNQVSNKLIELSDIKDNLIDDRVDKIGSILSRATLAGVYFRLNIEKTTPNSIEISFKNKNGYNMKDFSVKNFKSNCLKMNSLEVSRGLVVIKTETALCNYTDNPFLSFLIPVMGNYGIVFQSPVDVNLNKVSLQARGNIIFKSNTIENNKILSSNVSITINSKYNYPFVIKSVRFNFQGNNVVIINKIDYRVQNSGLVNLNLSTIEAFDAKSTTSKDKTFAILDYDMEILNINTQTTELIKFTNNKYTTDW